METTTPLVPEGISHNCDTSGLSPEDRLKHHTRQLRSVAFHRGVSGVAEYKERYPDAAPIRVDLKPLAYTSKPKGYGDQLANIVAGWFISDTALAATNRADVARLNARLGTDRFDPDRHFSKSLSPSVLRKIAAVFAQEGAHLDANANTMAKVRRAVKAAKASADPAAVPFAGVGCRSGDRVTIGRHTFRIEVHNELECIRLVANGSRVRLRLDAVAELISLAGLRSDNPGAAPNYLLCNSTRELAPSRETHPLPDPLEDIPPGKWPRNPAADETPLLREWAPDALGERIRVLTASREAGETARLPDGVDPLEL
jgi:hypothetical protein